MTRSRAALGAILFLAALAAAVSARPAAAFMKDGCGSGNCVDCHALTAEEAAKLLKPLEIEKVSEVRESPVKGLWAVDAERAGVKGVVFIDFGKKHVLQAQVVRLDTKENVTGVRKVHPSKIPLDRALLVGRAEASKTIVVFSDPDCHFCANLHEAIKQVVEKNPDIAFRIILFSRLNDPATVSKAAAVLCAKSAALLDNAYKGQPIPPADCPTTDPLENAKTATAFGVTGTPVLVMPDGRMIPGNRDADSILRLLKEGEAAPATPPAPGGAPATPTRPGPPNSMTVQ